MDNSIAVAMITSATGIMIALIGAWSSSQRAVLQATAPLIAENSRLRKLLEDMGVDPDA